MDIFSENLIIVLGLLIPFAGILFPLLVLLLFQVSHPETREPPTAPSENGAQTMARPVPTLPPGERTAPGDRPPAPTEGAEAGWLRERLRESDAFEGLTDNELARIAAIGHRRTVTAGERLAEGGSRGETLFVILEGDLQLLTHTTPEVSVRTAHAGEAVPLAVIIDPPVLVTTVEALADGEVFAIPRGQLLDLLDKQPLIGFHVYKAAAKAFEHRYRMTLHRGDFSSEGHARDA